jgi:hypothetical protein
MQTVRLLTRRGLRRQAGALAGIVLVLAAGLGTSLASMSVAWRTDEAFPRYLRQAEVGDVVVNPSILTDRLFEVVR